MSCPISRREAKKKGHDQVSTHKKVNRTHWWVFQCKLPHWEIKEGKHKLTSLRAMQSRYTLLISTPEIKANLLILIKVIYKILEQILMVKQLNSPFKIRNQTRLSYIITKNRRCHNWQGTNRIPVHKWQTVTTESKCQQLKTMPKRLRLKIHGISMQMADEIRTKLKNKDRQIEVLRQQNKPGTSIPSLELTER